MQIYRIPRNSLAWMLCAHVAAILPHVAHLPLWLMVMSGICVLWRVMVHQGRWMFPGRILRGLFVVVGGCAIFVYYKATLNSEAGVALLVMSFSLKLLEMYRKRDAYLQVLLAYFVIGSGFLFFTSIWAFLYLMVVFALVTAALIGLNQNRTHVHPLRTFQMAFLLCVQAMPIVVVLFIFFPRLPPLWAFSLDARNTITGLSESMTPSDMANLANKSALAFRASFESTPPPQQDLYWRALVFSHFDGKTWSQWPDEVLYQNKGLSGRVTADKDIDYVGRVYRYSVLMQPTLNSYLVSLDMPDVRIPSVFMTRDYRLVRTSELREPFLYPMTSYLDYRVGVVLDPQTRDRALQLPEGLNPRSVSLAQGWLAEAHGDVTVYVRRVLTHFKSEAFYYTLHPPPLNKHRIDAFLFDTKQGYCAHYAGAFVFLMRAAGVPARVVGGYQGGEINWLGNFVSVHQFEAHAWAEVWLAGKGWVRMDPTAEVAPSRVLESVREALREDGSFLAEAPFAPIRYDNRIVRGMRHTFDFINYKWHQNIVGFDGVRQRDFLRKYFSAIRPDMLAVVAILMLCCISLVVALILFRIRPSLDLTEMDVLYRQFQLYVKALGVARQPGETPEQFQVRACKALPHMRGSIVRFTCIYTDQQYRPLGQRSQGYRAAVRTLRAELHKLRTAMVPSRIGYWDFLSRRRGL